MQVLFFKQDLEEAGIAVPDKDHPWTFSEFLDILEQLKPIMDSKNGYSLDMTFPVGEASIYYYASFIWSNGGDLISEDGLTADGGQKRSRIPVLQRTGGKQIYVCNPDRKSI